MVDHLIDDDFSHETWLNIYGRQFAKDILYDENETQLDSRFMSDNPIESFFDDCRDEYKNASYVLLQGLRTLRCSDDYPSVEITEKIFSFLQKGMDEDVDDMLVTESYRMLSRLIHSMLPSNETFANYWRTIFYFVICGKGTERSSTQFVVQRRSFIELLGTIANLYEQSRLSAAAVYLNIICELLEADFYCFLKKNARERCEEKLLWKGAPIGAKIFWHSRSRLTDQTELVKWLLKILDRAENAQMIDSISRLFAMFVEISRLSASYEIPEIVNLERIPPALRNLLKDINNFSPKSAIQRLSDSIAFGWVKRELNGPSDSD